MPDRTDAPGDGPRPASPGRTRRVGAVAAGIVVAVAATVLVLTAMSESTDSPAAGTAPRFADITASSGVEHVYDGEFDFFVGGGVAVFDCDGDERPELYLAGGDLPASLYRNESGPSGPPRFTRMDAPETDLRAVTGAYPLDVDGDGQVDLAVLRHGENALLRGLGDCRFEAEHDALGLDGGDDWTTAFSATWEPDQTLPSMVFGNYLVPGSRGECADSHLFRPDGERYAEPVALSPGYCTLSALFSDWNRSGQRDLRLTNDRHYYTDGSEQLWEIEAGAAPRSYDSADGWRPLRIWGMGIASQDVTGDGLTEVFLTSQGDNKLQSLATGPDQPTYHDIALRSGVTAQRPYAGGDVLPSTAWHPEFDDVNNDGHLDLFVTKGNVEAQPDHAERDPNNLLLAQGDGTYAEGAEQAGITDFERSRGAAVVDLDLDGLLDLVVMNRRTGVKVWHNLGDGSGDRPEQMGHWISIRPEQPPPNTDAIGAWIEVRVDDRVVAREVTVGGGHASGQLGWIHFGLGPMGNAEVRVVWPDGETGPWMDTAADRFVVVERGAPEPTEWRPDEGS